MGIESEKLVYDYLSRVGDLAQQQGLPSGERMRLVSGLRADIDHRRSTGGTDSPAGVKRILAKLGTPAEVVAAAGGSGGSGGSGRPSGSGGSGGDGTAGGSGGSGGGQAGESTRTSGAARAARDKLAGLAERTGLSNKVPSPREPNGTSGGTSGGDTPLSLAKHMPVTPEAPETPRAKPPGRSSAAASPPHLAGEDELGPRESNPDWWHVEPGPFAQPEHPDGQFGFVEGFVGGIELPELLGNGKTVEQEQREKREAEKRAAEEAAEAEAAEAVEDAGADTGGKGPRRRGLVRRTLLGPGKSAGAEGGTGKVGARAGWAAGLSPVLLLAIALLVAGAVMGNIVLLAFGWVLTYSTGKLSRAEAKWAVMGMPGLVAAGAMVWVWGRTNDKWGDLIPKDGMKDVLTETWPVVVRGAAVATVLFLVWRARRRGGTG
ncbi:hypothetical protein ACFZCY_00485 [Streptomyces sp. NPDC007983]|uniref:hypothetical protein n=1 Tax=Streptomyces sp. NPDC007983 TaxID=3364800 RepID=UPI0036F0DC2B